MKEKTWKEQQTEQQRGRKRYIERLEQTREANKEIEEYENLTDGSEISGLDGERLISRERGEGFVS